MSGVPRYRRLTRCRDAAIIAGIVTLVLAGLELGSRRAEARALARRTSIVLDSSEAPARHPNADTPWFWSLPDPVGRLTWGSGLRYDPFRGWWPEPYSHPHVNIDSSGIRLTVQTLDTTVPRRTIYLFGGSTMWGVAARDAHTIPSRVAARLRTAGITDVEVVNMGQAGFTFTQGAVSLLSLLRNGDVPAAAVFLEGVNDVASTFISGRAGEVYNQDVIAQVFTLRRRGAWGAIQSLVRRSALVRRLSRRPGHSTPLSGAGRADACVALASQYHALGSSLAVWGNALGFQTLLLWQPTVATTDKELTPWELQLLRHPAPEIAGLPEMLRTCTARVDSLFDGPDATYFRNLSGMFDHDPNDVFIDHYGHVTERANDLVAERIVALLAGQLSR